MVVMTDVKDLAPRASINGLVELVSPDGAEEDMLFGEAYQLGTQLIKESYRAWAIHELDLALVEQRNVYPYGTLEYHVVDKAWQAARRRLGWDDDPKDGGHVDRP